MSTTARRRSGLTFLGIVVAVASVSIGVGVSNDPGGGNMSGDQAAILLAGMWLYWVLGVIVVTRADGHPVGWLFAVASAMFASAFGCWAASFTLSMTDGTDTARGWLTLLGALLFPPATILILPAVAMVFPTGRLPGPRWRWIVRIIGAILVLGSVAIIVAPGSLDGTTPNPLGGWSAGLPPWLNAFLGLATGAGTLAIVVALIAGVAAIVVRFRRARGQERAQLKWLVAAVIPAAVVVPWSLVDTSALAGLLSSLALPVIATSITIALLRYHLYDIDRIISRTLGWAAVTGLLVAVFAAGVVALQALLTDVTQGQTLAVAASTLVAFALFQPVRRRVQRAVDRRFDRARYDAERMAIEFADRLRAETDLGSVAADLTATARSALAPSALALWIRETGR